MARYIDADALIDFLDVGHLRHPSELCFSEVDVANLLLHAPTITPDEVRGVGEWLNDVGEFGFPEIPCSVCGYKSGHYGFKYCPNCGAKMEVTDDA